MLVSLKPVEIFFGLDRLYHQGGVGKFTLLEQQNRLSPGGIFFFSPEIPQANRWHSLQRGFFVGSTWLRSW
jgi:hypothetical protein